MRKKKTLIIALVIFAGLLFTGIVQKKYQFILGGAFINIGYFLQDGIEEYDFKNGKKITPKMIVKGLMKKNDMAATVRENFPRSPYHPLVALVVCMDSRLDTNEVIGDTRKYYYFIRTAGSVIKEKEEEMLELAVSNGVKVVVFTTHSNCAAEKVANDPEKSKIYPNIAKAVAEREKQIQEFLARPEISKRIKEGTLVVKRGHIDTDTKKLTLLD